MRVIMILIAGAIAAGGNAVGDDVHPLRETIDTEIGAAWQRNQIEPAPQSSDSEFLRRIYLDLIGAIPTYDETVQFLADTSPDKSQKLIDSLLERPEYARHQADIWDLILFGRNPPGYDTDKRDGIQRWLNEKFASNRPYKEWVRELLRAEGNSVEHGPPVYLMQYRNQPEDASEAISQTFLGVQLQCARCHDHPFEPWTQLDFYGMAAFFARLNVVTVGKKENLTQYAIGEKSTGDVLFTGPAKDQQPGKKGEPVKPKFLLEQPLIEPPLPEGFNEVKFENNKPPPPPAFSRKDQLADWITGESNPFFAQAIANRLWAQFMGRGLVHPVDNMSPSNKPSHPELLAALTAGLKDHQFDLKWYIRELVSSRTYQLSSGQESSDPQPLWFEHARWRPLSAEELVESWRIATGFETSEKGKDAGKKQSRFRPLSDSYVLRFFGQPNNGTGDFQGGLAEHLYLNNGQLGSLIVTSPGSLLDVVSKKEMPAEDKVDRLFLQMLNRPPTSEERRKFAEALTAEADPQERLRDAIWAVMTCSEFRFNK